VAADAASDAAGNGTAATSGSFAVGATVMQPAYTFVSGNVNTGTNDTLQVGEETFDIHYVKQFGESGVAADTGSFFAAFRHTSSMTWDSANSRPSKIDGSVITYYTDDSDFIGEVTLAGHEDEPDMKFYLSGEINSLGVTSLYSATEVEQVSTGKIVTAEYSLNYDESGNEVDFVTVWSSYGDDYLFGQLANGSVTLSGTAPFDWDAYSATPDPQGDISAISGGDGLLIDVSTHSSDAFAIEGSDYNDTIVGSDNGDLIDGMEGNDTMTGGGGDDIFIFDTNFSDADIDVIKDFSAANMGQDMVVLEGSEVFDANGYYGFIFESGNISGTTFTPDSDGSGPDAAIKFVDTSTTSQMILLQGVDASKLVFADIEDSVAIWLHNV
jgi:Ca2+-binding RTX toxin-like protein